VEHLLEMPASIDQDVVEALRSNEPLAERVGPRCPDRRAEDLYSFRLEHAVEGTGELGVPVVQEEPNAAKPLFDRHFLACWVTQESGWAVAPTT
jgi:hypothetical protein